MQTLRIAQYRYYGENNPLNFPNTMLKEEDGAIICPTADMLKKYNTVLEGMTETAKQYNQIVKLNVTTIPGTCIYLHNSSRDNSIIKYIIGATGILDLDLSTVPINIKGITIDAISAEILKNNPDSYFIITVIYQVKEEE